MRTREKHLLKSQRLGQTNFQVPRLASGCMRISGSVWKRADLAMGAMSELESRNRLLTALDDAAREYGTDRTSVALAWLLKHPAGGCRKDTAL